MGSNPLCARSIASGDSATVDLKLPEYGNSLHWTSVRAAGTGWETAAALLLAPIARD